MPIPASIANSMLRSRAATISENSTSSLGTTPPGVIPIYGRFCTTVTYGGRTQIEWRDYVTGHTSFDTGIVNGILPQNPVPGGLSLQNHLKMNRAFANASSALARPRRGRNPCLDFFSQGRSLEEISKIFKNLWDTVTANPYSAPPIAGTINSGQGMNARLNLYAPFFADTGETQAGMLAGYHWEPARGRYEELFTSLTPRQYRALTILHEFAHALGLIPSDKNDKRAMDSQSQKNDELIYEKCGKFLASLPAQ